MKHRYIIAASLLAGAALTANAQYYQIANQLPQMIQPALSGSASYKGFVEASYVQGVGNNKADFLEFTTTQGFTYGSWFFMGVGAGVDVMFSHTASDWGNWNDYDGSFDVNTKSRTTAAMIPLYTDFRFNLGNRQKTSFFIDIRLGAAFLIGKDYVAVGNGYITNQEYFYLKPSLGVRMPLGETGKQAINFGVTYQLLTSNYWNRYSSHTTLNGLGANVSFEW